MGSEARLISFDFCREIIIVRSFPNNTVDYCLYFRDYNTIHGSKKSHSSNSSQQEVENKDQKYQKFAKNGKFREISTFETRRRKLIYIQKHKVSWIIHKWFIITGN